MKVLCESERCYLAFHHLNLYHFSRCKRDTTQARGFEPRDLLQTLGTACCKHAIILKRRATKALLLKLRRANALPN